MDRRWAFLLLLSTFVPVSSCEGMFVLIILHVSSFLIIQSINQSLEMRICTYSKISVTGIKDPSLDENISSKHST